MLSKYFELPILRLLAAVLIVGWSSQTFAGTAFTYQGQLKDSVVVTATCSMDFKLSSTAGTLTQVGATQTKSVSVVEGLFTIQDLDFGNQFDGNDRWLEITANCGSGATTLTPRQPLTPIPYAIHAQTATALAANGANCNAGEYPLGVNASGAVEGCTAGGAGTVTSVAATANKGVTVAGTAIDPTVGLTACTIDQVMKHNGTDWACGADTDTTIPDTDTNITVTATASKGVTVAGTAIAPTVGLSTCANGEVMKSDGTDWACTADATGGTGTVTSVAATANKGIAVGGQQLTQRLDYRLVPMAKL